MINKRPVERVYPDDKRVKPQTIAHHKARYKWAANIYTGGTHALDLACGTGYGTEMLRRAGYLVTGVDKSISAIDYARAHYPLNTYRLADINNKDIFNKEYDLIVLFEALEHVTKKQGITLLKRIVGALAPEGVFVMSIPRDINKNNNGFHKSNWSYAELARALKRQFRGVCIYGQDWDTAKITFEKAEVNDFYIALANNNEA